MEDSKRAIQSSLKGLADDAHEWVYYRLRGLDQEKLTYTIHMRLPTFLFAKDRIDLGRKGYWTIQQEVKLLSYNPDIIAEQEFKVVAQQHFRFPVSSWDIHAFKLMKYREEHPHILHFLGWKD